MGNTEDFVGEVLHALWSGDADTAQLALDMGLDVNAALPYVGGTVMSQAATRRGGDEAGTLWRVRWLLSRGARVACELQTPREGTSLHVAAEEGSAFVLEALLAADGTVALEAFDYLERTPLACAAQAGQVEAARRLLAAGADPNAHDEERIGETPLAWAVEGKSGAAVALLLEHGASPAVPGWMQLTLLHRTETWAKSCKPELRRIYALLREPRPRAVKAH